MSFNQTLRQVRQMIQNPPELPPKVKQEQEEMNAMLAAEMQEEEDQMEQMSEEALAWHHHLRWQLEEVVEIPAHLNPLKPQEIPLKTLQILWKEQTADPGTGESKPYPGTYPQ